jgi:anti-anti-sigma regulatory factor
MDTKSRIENTVAILELSGRFDAFEAPAVTEWLEQATTS